MIKQISIFVFYFIFLAKCEDFSSLFSTNYTELAPDPTQIMTFQNTTAPMQFTQYQINNFQAAYQSISISMWVRITQTTMYQGRKIPLYLVSSSLNGNIDYSDSRNVRLLFSAQNMTNGLQVTFETFLASGSQCFQGNLPVVDGSNWFFIYHGINLQSFRTSCYIYSPSIQAQAFQAVSTGTTANNNLGSSFTIFLGGVLRPAFANWFGAVSIPRVYVNSYYEDINSINKLLMIGKFTQIYREYLSINSQLGMSIQYPNSYNFTNYKSSQNVNSFIIDGFTFISFSFTTSVDWPLSQILLQIIPTNPLNSNRIVVDVLNNNLRITFNGFTYKFANLNNPEQLTKNQSYNLFIFLYKALGNTVLMVKYYLTTVRNQLDDSHYYDFQWVPLSSPIDITNNNYYLYFGKAQTNILIYNVFVSKGGLFYRNSQDDCLYTLMDLNTPISNSGNKNYPFARYCVFCKDAGSYVLENQNTNSFCSGSCGGNYLNLNQASLFCQNAILNMIPCSDTVNCLQCQFAPANCITCQSGQYAKQISQYQTQCTQCGNNCSACTNAQQCTQCNSNYALSNLQQCVSCSNYDSDCLTCNTNGCTQCGTKNLGINGQCVQNCDYGQYLQVVPINQCVKCDNNCLACSLNSQNQYTCSVCKDRIVNQNGVASQIFQDFQNSIQSCVTQCRAGYFGNAATYQCQACSSQICATCQNSADNCLQCASTYNQLNAFDKNNNPITLCSNDCINYASLDSNGNIQSTPISNIISNIGFYVNAALKQCSPCPTGCTLCNGNTYQQCTAADNLHTFLNSGDSSTYYSDSCKLGYYFVQLPKPTDLNIQCLKCDPNCLGCQSYSKTLTTPNGKQCTSCSSGSFLDSNLQQCVQQCSSGYFQNKTTNTCDKCYTTCKECVAGTMNDCTTACQNGATIQIFDSTNLNIFSCVLSCSMGYYLNVNVTPIQCQQCPQQCATCQTNSGCTSCAAKYFRGPVVANQNYLTCTTNCTAMAQPDQLDQNHIIGYFNNPAGNICSECHPYCSACNSASLLDCTQCTVYQGIQFYLQKTIANAASGYCTQSCLDGYIQQGGANQPYVCQSCTQPCLTCSQTTDNCTSCYSGFYLKTTTSPQTCVDQNSCGLGYYGDRNSLKCQICDASCYSCSGTSTNCTSCKSGQKLKNNICIQASQYCGDGYFDYKDQANLLSCQKCDQSCYLCKDDSMSCTACKLGLFAYNKQCISQQDCLAKFMIPDSSSGICMPCATGCLQCKNTPTNCQLCDTSLQYYFQSPSKCVLTCDPGYFPTTQNNIQVCSQCYSTCSQCKDSTPSSCSACNPGYYLTQSKQCVATKSCPDGFYGDDLTNTCKPCDSKCATCFNPKNNQCNSCNKGYYLYNHSCQPCMTGCIDCTSLQNCNQCDSTQGYFFYQQACYKTCPSGYLGDIKQSPSCIQCAQKCLICSGKIDTCTQCNLGYYSNASDCSPCSQYCQQCTNSTTCQQCQSGTYLINSGCTTKCPIGMFGNQITQMCQNCDTSCSTCNGPYQFDCLSCQDPSKVVKEGVCVDPNQCIGSYFLDKNNNCSPCDQGCLSCNQTSSNCSLCDSNYFFTNYYANGQVVTRCFKVCPTGYIPSSAQDQQNQSNILNQCIQCTQNCTSCAAPLYLYGNQCLASCPNGFIGSTSSNTCIKSNNIFCQINNLQSSSVLDPTKPLSFQGYLATTQPISTMVWTLSSQPQGQQILTVNQQGIPSGVFNTQKVLILPPNTLQAGTQYQLSLHGTLTGSSDVCDKQLQFKTSSQIQKGTLSVQKIQQQYKLDTTIQAYQFTISGFSTSDSGQNIMFDIVLINSQTNLVSILVAQQLSTSQPIQYTYLLQNQLEIQTYIPQVIAYTASSQVSVQSSTQITTQGTISKQKAIQQINSTVTSAKFLFSSLDDINYLTNLFYQSYLSDFKTTQKNQIAFQSFFDVYDSLNGNYQSTCNQSFFCSNQGTCAESKSYIRKCICNKDYSGDNCEYLGTEFGSIKNLISSVTSSSLITSQSTNMQSNLLKLSIIHNLSIAKGILSLEDLRILISVFFYILQQGTTQIQLTATSFPIIQDTIQNILRSMFSTSALSIIDKANIDKLISMYEQNIFLSTQYLAGQKNYYEDGLFSKFEVIYLNNQAISGSTKNVFTIQSQLSNATYQIPLSYLQNNSTVMYFVSIQQKYNIYNQYTSYGQFSTSLFSSLSLIDGLGAIIDISSFDQGMLIQLPKNYNYNTVTGNSGQKYYRCTYLQEYTNKWQEDGCQFVSETLTQIVCSCTHLTTFSVQSIPYNLQQKPTQLDILNANGWSNLQEFLNNHKDGIVIPDTPEVVQPSKWFPNPIGLYALLIILGLYIIFSYTSIWIQSDKVVAEQKRHLTYHPLLSIIFGQNTQEVSSSMKILQLFIQIIGILFINCFLDTLNVALRVIICILVSSAFHSLIFRIYNHKKYQKVTNSYPNQKYLSQVDQINMNYDLRQFKMTFYIICSVLYLIEGIGLSVAGNLIDTNKNLDFIISCVISIIIDIAILDSLIFLIAHYALKNKEKLSYFFKINGYYDLLISNYVGIRQNEQEF
ncbi:latrophilin/CL-like GPS domain protein (macronuclear) [Tetrahymena thermophila SB210]|uniref:Latrophilin/CL-like GPS domain protein n=1 Tax=Tetrahymena thermophila (strain SB210) TaxID=312017 RepID=Q23DK6_TETTS|nr:latrophilin/CL-like GPS domain protein [Tetrahymena thermophila SB210]EAR94687.2 latrophilin/CL-like GPS domain protein [Tetrahymena thermophila SB210]|eukprot:XP_001014680.2 latrophilin/CL-like GPS domain protein [Tetrahymena thermophila SB210]